MRELHWRMLEEAGLPLELQEMFSGDEQLERLRFFEPSAKYIVHSSLETTVHVPSRINKPKKESKCNDPSQIYIKCDICKEIFGNSSVRVAPYIVWYKDQDGKSWPDLNRKWKKPPKKEMQEEAFRSTWNNLLFSSIPQHFNTKKFLQRFDDDPNKEPTHTKLPMCVFTAEYVEQGKDKMSVRCVTYGGNKK